jgi:flagellum-specific peptidoglycan hydrolase FlgJ
MKICSSEQEYIDIVAPLAQKACKRFQQELGNDFYLPSVLIGQSIKENGYGIPSYWDNPGVMALVEVNNMVGIKKNLLNPSWVDVGLTVWEGEFINKKTPEVYGGVQTTIYDDFRIYRDKEGITNSGVEISFVDYLCFMRWGGYSVGNPKYYNNIKNLHDYRSLIKEVHRLGYATGLTYSDGVIKIIEKHNLTKYDNLEGVEPSKYYPTKAEKKEEGKQEEQKSLPTLQIKKYYLTRNRCYQQGKRRNAIGIQVHSIGTGQNTAQSLADYWNQQSIGVCVTYACDAEVEGLALQFVPEDYATWADKGWGNKSLITIEMMESDYIKYTGNGAEYKVTNMDRFKADIIRSYNTCVLLCADICKRYKWNPTSKLSNGMYLISSHNEGRIAGLSSAHVDPNHIWDRFGLTMDKFRKDVASVLAGGGISKEDVNPAELYRVRKSWSDASSQLGAYQYLENAKNNCPVGYNIYNKQGKLIYSNTGGETTPTTPTTPTTGEKVYRVRLGIFTQQANIDRLKKRLKDKLGLETFEEKKKDGTHVYCGSFSNYANAEDRVKILNGAGFDTKIVEK